MKLSKIQIICGAHDFVANAVLEFLELVEIVKILTIIHQSRLKMVPTDALLAEILRKALVCESLSIPVQLCFINQLYSQHMEIRPTLFIISEDKTLTMHTMSKIYDLIKERAVKN
jgi:hypothetical protein